MKLKVLLLAFAVCFLFSACVKSLDPAEEFPEDGLITRIQRLSLNRTELATIAGNDLLLVLTKTPPNAIRNDVTWVSSNPAVANVDQNGKIVTIQDTNQRVEAVIRVFSNDDPSIYDECIVSVFPDYGNERYWNFAGTVEQGTTPTPNEDQSVGWFASRVDSPVSEQTRIIWANGTTSDRDIGLGMTLRGATGSGSYNEASVAPNGLPISSGRIPTGADPALYPPYPWVYVIDPEDPYEMGLTPGNGTRSGLNLLTGQQGTSFRSGFLTTGGSGRIISIAAIQGPFYIEVRYQTNSNGANRWADIRIGDREGLRIQGEPSDHGSNAGSGKRNFYFYENDDIVPFVHIEGAQGGAFRIYEIIILPEPPADD
jgi:hypothetical protein